MSVNGKLPRLAASRDGALPQAVVRSLQQLPASAVHRHRDGERARRLHREAHAGVSAQVARQRRHQPAVLPATRWRRHGASVGSGAAAVDQVVVHALEFRRVAASTGVQLQHVEAALGTPHSVGGAVVVARRQQRVAAEVLEGSVARLPPAQRVREPDARRRRHDQLHLRARLLHVRVGVRHLGQAELRPQRQPAETRHRRVRNAGQTHRRLAALQPQRTRAVHRLGRPLRRDEDLQDVLARLRQADGEDDLGVYPPDQDPLLENVRRHPVATRLQPGVHPDRVRHQEANLYNIIVQKWSIFL